MTSPALDLEPACPGAPSGPTSTPAAARSDGALQVEQRPFDDIPRASWDRLAAANPWATPFSGWAFQRAWWDAYGGSAHDQTLIVCDGPRDEPIAIVPLMHRHEVEPDDAGSATKIRHGDAMTLTPVPATAKAVFFGASYHADYATILGDAGALSGGRRRRRRPPRRRGLRGRSRPSDAVGRRRPAPAALRRSRRRRPGGRVRTHARSTSAGPSTSSARTSAPS